MHESCALGTGKRALVVAPGDAGFTHSNEFCGMNWIVLLILLYQRAAKRK